MQEEDLGQCLQSQKKMKSNIFYIIIFSLFISEFNGQTEIYGSLKYQLNEFAGFSVTISSETTKKFYFHENNEALFNQELVTNFDSTIGSDNYFFTNAGIVDSVDNNCELKGLFIENSVTKKAINLSNGSGNFFLKPNGVLIIKKDSAIITNSDSAVSLLNDSINMAIQSGPMLIFNDTINPLFNPNSPNKHIRSGVGISFENNNAVKLIFVISKNPVTFFEISNFLKDEFNCKQALCLESGLSTMKTPYYPLVNNKQNQKICKLICYKNI